MSQTIQQGGGIWFQREEFIKRSYGGLLWCGVAVPGSCFFFKVAADVSVSSPLLWMTGSLSGIWRLQFLASVLVLTGLLVLATGVYMHSILTASTSCSDTVEPSRHPLKPRQLIHVVIFMCSGLIGALVLSLNSELAWANLYFNGSFGINGISEGLLFLCGYGAAMGLSFAVSLHHQQKYRLKFPLLQQTLIFRAKKSLSTSLKSSLYLCAKALQYYVPLSLFFGFLRRQFISSSFSGSASGSEGMSYSALWISVLAGITLTFLWNMALNVFQIFNTQHYEFSILDAGNENAGILLKDSLKAENVVLKHLGFMDLLQLSRTPSPRRQQIFHVTNSGFAGHVYSAIVDESVSLFERASRLLFKECKEAEQVLGSTALPSVSSPPSAELIGVQQLFSPTLKSEELQLKKSAWWAAPGNLVHRKHCTLPVSPVLADSCGKAETAEQDFLFSNFTLLLWAVEGVCNLIAASLIEDKHGIVQQRLVEVLSSLFVLLEAVETFVRASALPHTIRRPKPLESLHDHASKAVSLKLAVKTGIYKVSSTFGSRISSLRLEPTFKQRLQDFIVFKD